MENQFIGSLEIPYEVFIVGAGPAGLTTAMAVQSNSTNFLLIDEGIEHTKRDRYSPEDVVSGVGGAGLFSDGKYSFYPASTNLWNLQDQEQLKSSFNWVSSMLRS